MSPEIFIWKKWHLRCASAGQQAYNSYIHENFSLLDRKVPIWLLESRCTSILSNIICLFYFFYSELIKNILFDFSLESV